MRINIDGQRVKINNDFNWLEITFIVQKWNKVYREFNEFFCDIRRPVSLVIETEQMYHDPGTGHYLD